MPEGVPFWLINYEDSLMLCFCDGMKWIKKYIDNFLRNENGKFLLLWNFLLRFYYGQVMKKEDYNLDKIWFNIFYSFLMPFEVE